MIQKLTGKFFGALSVAELIEELQKFDPNACVCYINDEIFSYIHQVKLSEDGEIELS